MKSLFHFWMAVKKFVCESKIDDLDYSNAHSCSVPF